MGLPSHVADQKTNDSSNSIMQGKDSENLTHNLATNTNLDFTGHRYGPTDAPLQKEESRIENVKRALSASCRLIASSVLCEPGVIDTRTCKIDERLFPDNS